MTREPFDLDRRSRDALDFDVLLDWLSGYARTPFGAAEVRRTSPFTDPATLQVESELSTEMTRYLDREGSLVPGGLPAAEDGTGALARGGQVLSAVELRSVASVVHSAGELASLLARLDAEEFPRLRAIGRAVPDLRRLAGRILKSIAPDGSLEDDASPELRRVRRALLATGERLQRQLRSHLKRPDADVVLRDDFITQRGGRFVIPVRTDAPHPLRGIVHATSSSGATQFVEPLDTVETNNELVRLSEQERFEIERLLLGWSEELRARFADVEIALSSLARLDACQARVLFGRSIDGTLATVGTEEPLRVVDLRHPLLERRLREEGRPCVPLTLELDPAARVLVLSGPNAGGKTVTLKSLGLIVLMAQCTIPIPAREVRLPLYGQLRADIGDHQSMQADLSTFSAHVQATHGVLRDVSPPALFLFDEIGTGTDPGEGAALARAVLESLMRADVTVVATTHQTALKSWAHTTDGASSAAMEFDSERLRPTYRVLPDTAGVSAGLEIARRVGLPDPIVERARELMGPVQTGAEDYLNRLQRQSRELEKKSQALVRRTAELEHEAAEQREAARARLDRDRDALRLEVQRVLKGLEKRTEVELRQIEEESQRARARRRAERLRDGARRELASVTSTESVEILHGAALEPEALEPGLTVWVGSLGRTGTIERADGARVRVLVGSIPTTVDASELYRPPPRALDPRPTAKPSDPAYPGSRRVVRGDDGLDESPESELMLLGKTVDEAEELLDRFLDRATVAGLAQVRVVHGHGTGRLRRAVRQLLEGHALVREHRPGRGAEGGDGATVVTLV